MEFNLVAALVGGFVGTVAMTALLMMAPRMGMPEMDVPGLLGSMFGAPGNRMMGLAMHVMMGLIFGVIYGALFSAIAANIILLGVLIGIVHWLVVGMAMGMVPMMHAGIRSGAVEAPGVYMMRKGGMMSFMGGLLGHVVYGLVVGIVYGLVVGGFGG